MISPQVCIKDFKSNKYLEQNSEFLLPIYDTLFQETSNSINIDSKLKEAVSNLKNYFNYLEKIRRQNNIKFTDKPKENKKIIVDKFVSLIDEEKLASAINSILTIVNFIEKKRKNINGLELLSWSLFQRTRKDEIVEDFRNDTSEIENALTSFGFISHLIKYPHFIHIALMDLLSPAEFKSPTRRKGSFDKLVFEKVCNNLKQNNIIIRFEDQIPVDSLKGESNWLITERIVKKINFPSPKRTKFPDVVCKINNKLIIGAHKEQKQTGGGQDNQAEDARRIFEYSQNDLEKIKKEYKVDDILLCVILDANYKSIKSNHWNLIFSIVELEENKNEYLLNSVQFIELIKSIKD